MLAFSSEEEHFGLRRRTTQNKLFVPNYEAKTTKNYCFSSQIERACPQEPCCCVGSKKLVANGMAFSAFVTTSLKFIQKCLHKIQG